MKHCLQSRSDPDISTMVREWLVKVCLVFVWLLYSLEKPLVWDTGAKSLFSKEMNRVSEAEELLTHIKATTLMLFKGYIFNYFYYFGTICVSIAKGLDKLRFLLKSIQDLEIFTATFSLTYVSPQPRFSTSAHLPTVSYLGCH